MPINYPTVSSSASLTLAVLLLLNACSSGGAEREERAAGVSPSSAGAGQQAAVAAVSPPIVSEAELAGTPVGMHGALSVVGTQIVDAAGEPVQLKGPSSMWLNWEQSGYAKNAELITLMRDEWGASIVRAAMGVEPGGAYLSSPSAAEKSARDVIDNAISLGLYVIIDWHDHEAVDHVEESVAFFKKMAELYGEYPNVIYEVFNEPLKVDWSSELKPYHERLVSEIRAIDPDNLIILGTPNWSQYVDDASRDPVAGDNLAYTLHFYSCSHDASLRRRGDTALNAGLALFVTEWGATHSDGGTPENLGLCLDEGRAWHDWMNEHGISWAAWKLDDCVDESCYFTPGTQNDGSFTEDQLTGHGKFIREMMQTPVSLAPLPDAAVEPEAEPAASADPDGDAG